MSSSEYEANFYALRPTTLSGIATTPSPPYGVPASYVAMPAYAVPPMYATPYPPTYRPPNNGLATGGFVCSLIGLLALPPLAILGLILSGVGLGRSRELQAGKGLAIAGLVLGALGLCLLFAVIGLIGGFGLL